jgi:GNAT superfamily N-acetyltransferase
VLPDQQGKKLGLKVIQALDGIAEKVGCYKSILDCSEKNQGFYEKCGFKHVGIQMVGGRRDGHQFASLLFPLA